MPPFIETPMPPVPPDQRPERLMLFDSKARCADMHFVSTIYEWLYQVSTGEREKDARVQRHGEHILVLLPAPMRVTCTTTGWTFRVMGALLHEGEDKMVNGWLVDNHEEAIKTFEQLTDPEKALSDSSDDGPDYEPEEEE